MTLPFEDDEKPVEVDEIKTKFKYTLKVPFQYASGSGDVTDAEFILLKAPTSRNTKQCAALKQGFFRAMREQVVASAESQAPSDMEGAGELEGDDILSVMYMAKQVNMEDLMGVARELFQSPGIALVDGEHKLKTAMLDRLSAEDFEGMLGEYLANFTLASALAKLKDKLSRE